MNARVKPKIKIKIKSSTKRNETFHIEEKDSVAIPNLDCKFYQKLFLVFIGFSAILIFPESPKDMDIVCNRNYAEQICKVW